MARVDRIAARHSTDLRVCAAHRNRTVPSLSLAAILAGPHVWICGCNGRARRQGRDDRRGRRDLYLPDQVVRRLVGEPCTAHAAGVRPRSTMDGRSAARRQGRKISLREEPRLTLIQPSIDEAHNRLIIKLTKEGERAHKGTKLGETETVLRPTAEELGKWKEVPKVEMYGDFADGRVAALPESSGRKLSPSEWISEVSTPHTLSALLKAEVLTEYDYGGIRRVVLGIRCLVDPL